MDALSLLTADHNRVRGLFAQFKHAQEADDTAAMVAVGTKISGELTVHATIEEELFYPWARALSEPIAELVDEGIEEHGQVKTLLADASRITVGHEQWIAKMTVIIEDVEHHADEEETEMFPKVRSASDAPDREALGDRLDRRKGELGAPVLADTIDLTVEELRELASAQEIPGRSNMNHDELAATVSPA